MPKDPTKNIFQYKIRGGHLNEFEFQQNQGDVTEQKGRPWEKQNFDPNAQAPEEVLKDDGKGRKKTAANQGKSATTGATRKQPAKATKKKAQKKAAKATKKSAAKRSATKKSATKKSAGRKATATGRAKRATKK